jgi:ATP-binding cassette, subfamily A (ABC1), member 3
MYGVMNLNLLMVPMVAIGTIDSLSDRYGTYEVHFACRTREEVQETQTLMSRIPNSRMADDVATRFEVPVSGEQSQSLAGLFRSLAEHGQVAEFTVEKATLESVFLKVIRENDVEEENTGGEPIRNRRWWRRKGT